jgi:dipeptidase
MCDTLVALPGFTKNGSTIFAKNSDREPDEAQGIIQIPAKQSGKSNLDCTFISIPQSESTNEVILSKPFQMWGAEMGVNVHGLVIGNEAVFTNIPISKKNNGLTGMDMLRLALERCQNAKEAVAFIPDLLKKYGQDACGGYRNRGFFYHNSFLIADQNQAFVLETAGKSWASREVKHIGSISNGLTIETEYDQIHLSGEKRQFPHSILKKPEPFSFKEYFSDFLFTKVGKSNSRQACSFGLVQKQSKSFDAGAAMEVLRTHESRDPIFNPKKASTASLCMHATGLTNPSSTTGSMVAEIRQGKPHTVWLTGTSMPCLSVFIPFFFGTHVLEDFSQPSSQSDDSLWWQAEKVHQWICRDYQNRKAKIWPEFISLQNDFIKAEAALMGSNPAIKELENFSRHCLKEVRDLYLKILPETPAK